MSAPVALLGCTAFVVLLLLLERRALRHASAALWIPTLWMLLIASKPLAMWFGVAGDNESGSEADRLVLAGLGLAGIVVLAYRRFDCSSVLRRHGWLLVLLVYALVSTLWSDITLIALRRWMREVIVVIMGLAIVSEGNPREALETVLRRSAYVLIPFSLVLIRYYPALGREYGRWSGVTMWVGVALQKNSLGRLSAMAAIYLLWSLHRRWRVRGTAGQGPGSATFWSWLHRRWRVRGPAGGCSNAWAEVSVLLLALYLLKGADNAYSATSLGAFAVGITTFLGLLWCRKLKLRVPQSVLLAILIFLTGYGTSTPFLGGSNLASFTALLGRDETLTGRTEVWAAVLPVVQKQPLLGAGFGSFWTSARQRFYQIPHGHNGYLDILLDLGAVGLVLNTVWLLSCARKIHAGLTRNYDLTTLVLCFLLMAVLCNFTEPVLASQSEPLTAVITLASFVLPYTPIRNQRIKSRFASTRDGESGFGTAATWPALETRPKFTGRAIQPLASNHSKITGTMLRYSTPPSSERHL